eukprot:TRINITY_DN20941_c0_g1_i1.p1 TRINITY_DN20941_c0_g1~~TRINITY_DN20941_c0_g1_i1.p1  ORF type:complete len:426 (+),score=100.37 TRINITY_DN20941_c0_g1_i1:56-1279(+)
MAADARVEWNKAVAQLDFTPRDGMAALARLDDPPELVLRSLRAVVAVLGLCSGSPEDVEWSEIKSHLEDTKQFLSKMASFDADGDPARVKEILASFFESDEFRPRCVMVSSVPCAQFCAWCLALFVYSGGAPPSAGAAPAWPSPAQRRPAATTSDDEGEDDAGALLKADGSSADEAASFGVLRVRSGAGDVVATLERARATWTIFDVRTALKTAWPVPEEASQFGRPLHDVLVGDVRLTGRSTLAELGADPTASEEGAEVLGIVKPFPELNKEAKAAMELAKRELSRMSTGLIKELACLGRPPPAVIPVCQALYAALTPNVADPESMEWPEIQEFLFNNPHSLLKKINNYDINVAPELVMAHLERYKMMGHLDVIVLQRMSLACAIFATWLDAVLLWSRILSDFINS